MGAAIGTSALAVGSHSACYRRCRCCSRGCCNSWCDWRVDAPGCCQFSSLTHKVTWDCTAPAACKNTKHQAAAFVQPRAGVANNTQSSETPSNRPIMCLRNFGCPDHLLLLLLPLPLPLLRGTAVAHYAVRVSQLDWHEPGGPLAKACRCKVAPRKISSTN